MQDWGSLQIKKPTLIHGKEIGHSSCFHRERKHRPMYWSYKKVGISETTWRNLSKLEETISVLPNELSVSGSIDEEAGSRSDTDVVEKISDSQETRWDNLLGSFQPWYSMRSYRDKSPVTSGPLVPTSNMKLCSVTFYFPNGPSLISSSWALICHHSKKLALSRAGCSNYKCQGDCGS